MTSYPTTYTMHAKRHGFTIVEILIVVIVIGILASIVIVSYNSSIDNARQTASESEIAQMRIEAEKYKTKNKISCPVDYAFVYGNSTLGTSNFCVMKFEAKNVGGIATSQASGAPWTSISQTDAITASTAAGGHLITEAEWMTIAAEVLSVNHNWSSGEVGEGYIYSGHNDNVPSSALVASDSDTDGYTGTGESAGSNQKRTLYLKSGDVIWDFAGNMYEWTSYAQTMSNVGVSDDGAFFTWREWTLGSLSLGNLPAGSRPSALASLPGLSGITSWNSTQGIGQVYARYPDTASRGFLRGGGRNSPPNAGVLSLMLSSSPSTTSSYNGFRVAQ